MSVWKGGVWASQKGLNAVGPWKGSLWRSERSLTSLGIKKLLFSQGQQGVMYVPQPTVDGQQVLYQDSAGTTPVTADGQPVGYIKDLSGNGNHATQATAAAKPIYRTDGTLHWLEFDGVDDFLESINTIGISGSQERSIFTASKYASNVGGVVVGWGANSTGQACDIRSRSDGFEWRFWALDPQVIANQTNANVASFMYYGGALGANDSELVGADARINGIYKKWSTTKVYSTSATPNTTDSPLRIGLRANPFGGDVFGVIVVNKAVPADSIKDVESYLAELSGVTLP